MIIGNRLGSQLILGVQNTELTTCNQNITTRESIRARRRDLISVPYLSLSNASGLGTTILKQTRALVGRETKHENVRLFV